MPDDFDINALYAALDDKRQQQGLTWSGVSREFAHHFTKVSPGTISGIREKSRVEGDGVLQMLLWLDRTPESFVPGYRGPTELLSAPGRRMVLRWDTARIFTEIEQKREEQGLTWQETADQIGGMTPQQLKALAKGGRTSLPGAMRVAIWLGIPAARLTRASAI